MMDIQMFKDLGKLADDRRAHIELKTYGFVIIVRKAIRGRIAEATEFIGYFEAENFANPLELFAQRIDQAEALLRQAEQQP